MRTRQPGPASIPGWHRRRHEVGSSGGARDAEPLGVLLGREAADLELHPGEPLLAECRDLLGDVLVAVVPPIVITGTLSR